jgi:hypothetical protein
MNSLHLLAALGMICLLLASGCLTDYVERTTNPRGATPMVLGGGAATQEEAEITLLNLSTDKDIYHSAEALNLSALIHSSSDADGVSVSAKGIGGRMDMEKIVNLTGGETLVSFTYKLPRCNVCGGISAGNYVLTCAVTYGNETVENTTSVRIVQ